MPMNIFFTPPKFSSFTIYFLFPIFETLNYEILPPWSSGGLVIMSRDKEDIDHDKRYIIHILLIIFCT